MSKREFWHARNRTSKAFSIGDLPKIPTFQRSQTHNLLRYYSVDALNASSDLSQLIDAGWLDIIEEKDNAKTVRAKMQAKNLVRSLQDSEVVIPPGTITTGDRKGKNLNETRAPVTLIQPGNVVTTYGSASDSNVTNGSNLRTALAAATAGSVIELSAGTFATDENVLDAGTVLYIIPTDITLRGQGVEKTIVSYNGLGIWGARLVTLTSANNVVLEGIYFHGGGNTAGNEFPFDATVGGMRLITCVNVLIRNCRVDGILATNNKIFECAPGCTDIILDNFDIPQTASIAQPQIAGTFTNVRIKKCTWGRNFEMDATAGGASSGVIVHDNNNIRVGANGQTHFRLRCTASRTIRDVIVEGNCMTGDQIPPPTGTNQALFECSVDDDVTKIKDVIVANNTFEGSWYGVLLKSKGCVVSKNICRSAGDDGIRSDARAAVITHNICYDNLYSGIYVETGPDTGENTNNAVDMIIAHNICWDNNRQNHDSKDSGAITIGRAATFKATRILTRSNICRWGQKSFFQSYNVYGIAVNTLNAEEADISNDCVVMDNLVDDTGFTGPVYDGGVDSYFSGNIGAGVADDRIYYEMYNNTGLFWTAGSVVTLEDDGVGYNYTTTNTLGSAKAFGVLIEDGHIGACRRVQIKGEISALVDGSIAGHTIAVGDLLGTSTNSGRLQLVNDSGQIAIARALAAATTATSIDVLLIDPVSVA